MTAPTLIPAYYIQEDEERGHTRDKERLTTEDSVRKMTPRFCSCQTRLIANYSPRFTSTLACSSSSGSWIMIPEETVERPQVGPGLSLSLPSKTETRKGNQVTERKERVFLVSLGCGQGWLTQSCRSHGRLSFYLHCYHCAQDRQFQWAV